MAIEEAIRHGGPWFLLAGIMVTWIASRLTSHKEPPRVDLDCSASKERMDSIIDTLREIAKTQRETASVLAMVSKELDRISKIQDRILDKME